MSGQTADVAKEKIRPMSLDELKGFFEKIHPVSLEARMQRRQRKLEGILKLMMASPGCVVVVAEKDDTQWYIDTLGSWGFRLEELENTRTDGLGTIRMWSIIAEPK